MNVLDRAVLSGLPGCVQRGLAPLRPGSLRS